MSRLVCAWTHTHAHTRAHTRTRTIYAHTHNATGAYRILAEDGTAGHLEIETAREGIAGDEEELLLQADVGLQTLDVVAHQLEQTRALLAHGLPMRTKFSFIHAMFFCSSSRCVQNTTTHHRRGPAGSVQSSMELLMDVAWHPSIQFGLFVRQPNSRPHF